MSLCRCVVAACSAVEKALDEGRLVDAVDHLLLAGCYQTSAALSDEPGYMQTAQHLGRIHARVDLAIVETRQRASVRS